jgi:hypothetical protein
MTGTLRSEWHLGYTSLVVPCNWSAGYSIQPLEHSSPIDFLVAEARNIIADQAIHMNYKWLFFIDHDVCLPYNTLQILNEYMRSGNIPIVGGLYFTRGVPSEPLMYRRMGYSYYNKWKIGDKVWLSGMGLGCNIIHTDLLKSIAEDCEEYKVQRGLRVKRIFETPSTAFIDPETGALQRAVGTEDLHFYKRLKEGKHYKKAGFPHIQRKKYPILCDTRIFCTHIAMNGIRYPSAGEEKEYIRK